MHGSLYSATFDRRTATLRVAGLIDELVVDDLAADIARHSADHTASLRVDLTDVAFLPSIAIGVLVRSQRLARAQGCTIVPCAADGSLAQRVLAMVGLPYDAPAGQPAAPTEIRPRRSPDAEDDRTAGPA